MTIAIASLPPDRFGGPDAIRVLVVDDAVVARGLFARWIEAETGLRLVGVLRGGREAIEQVERADPDVVILDVDMPDIDGLTALPQLLAKKRDLVVIVASALTRRSAELSLRALSLGAADYISKPSSTRDLSTSTAFRRELIEKIRSLGARRWRPAPLPAAVPLGGAQASSVSASAPVVLRASARAAAAEPAIRLRPFPAAAPAVLLVGASTGGPQALSAILSNINAVIDRAPVLVVQHMPPMFTTILAEQVARGSGRTAREAADGEPVRAGQIYIAPGGRHMRIVRRRASVSIALDDSPPVNFCRPAVDLLFSSAAEVWGSRNLAVILTGMGCDGTRGGTDIARAGGAVIAQDETTSVVWGMPGAAAHAGICSAVLPLSAIAPKIVRLFSGGRP